MNKKETNKICDMSNYFEESSNSILIPVNHLVRDHLPSDEKIDVAVDLMLRAANGSHPKREPVSVRKLPDGRFLVVDGNTTTTVLMRWGCSHVLANEIDP